MRLEDECRVHIRAVAKAVAELFIRRCHVYLLDRFAQNASLYENWVDGGFIHQTRPSRPALKTPG
jgi:hypothetical protein